MFAVAKTSTFACRTSCMYVGGSAQDWLAAEAARRSAHHTSTADQHYL